MSQSHLVIDFPIKAPANAKALAEELPPLMPDSRKRRTTSAPCISRVSWSRARRSFSSFPISTARSTPHIERLVESAGPVFDAIFEHVDDPPATPAAGDPPKVIKWLKHHVREPIDTYFAYECFGSGHQGGARAAGFTGNTLQAPC